MDRFTQHNAFLIQDGKSEAEALYLELQKDGDVEVSFVYEKNLTIDTAREIKEMAMQTTYKAFRYIIVASYSVGHEAQNALLKTLEELPQTKKLIFVVESLEGLLPTFVSRFAKFDTTPSSVLQEKSKNISIKDLLKEVERICKDIKDEVSTKAAASRFLDELVMNIQRDHKKVAQLLYFKSCVTKPSASLKQILESAVALVG